MSVVTTLAKYHSLTTTFCWHRTLSSIHKILKLPEDSPNRKAIYLFILFCLPHNNYKKYRKRRKKKWRGDLTETIGAYERLGLLELWARAVWHQLKKRRRKVEDGKIYELFSYLLNNLIFSFFLKEERDWELRVSTDYLMKCFITPCNWNWVLIYDLQREDYTPHWDDVSQNISYTRSR